MQHASRSGCWPPPNPLIRPEFTFGAVERTTTSSPSKVEHPRRVSRPRVLGIGSGRSMRARGSLPLTSTRQPASLESSQVNVRLGDLRCLVAVS